MNEDPKEALDDDPINFYKGVPVIKTSLMNSSALSFGAIFVADNVDSLDLLYHEYGHIVQLEEVGILPYTVYVALPSVACFWATEAGLLHEDIYFSLPWENIADRYGDAKHIYYPGATGIADAYWTFVEGASFAIKKCLP